jgi:hypothetical protein
MQDNKTPEHIFYIHKGEVSAKKTDIMYRRMTSNTVNVGKCVRYLLLKLCYRNKPECIQEDGTTEATFRVKFAGSKLP